ncbi:cytochrome-c oxidase, cbb3-type subunit III [Inmirania thermothiophila]|uniref:Cbb3-type cytochrome c oxidase subunit n=1 Tax=Inmirania thermothiophila TaxID=1750597 RepID=A0A3N1Y6K5_9GAMM|nr:cytochrome-c oxidase, cbb3-type subunit III [Inmirania thermothiophila]ROR34459.1 cytochrome c oxidase cbb3-type subunit 3 [Inmirania thermothiophila]
MNERKDNPFGVPDTGHVWDDNLRELLNPPPRWWQIAFHASWIGVVIYLILFPGIPLVHDYTHGILGWSSIKRYKAQVAEVERIRAPFEQRIAALSAAEILKDPELKQYAIASARVDFGDKCAACHGAGGQGNPGFPVLADDDWLYGGTVEKIQETITNGRRGMMPAHAGRLSAAEIDALVRHVKALSRGGEDPEGKALFTGKAACFACHGRDGKGNQAIGAANLTDAIWRFSGTDEEIRRTIAHGVNDPSDPETRRAEMPAWKGKLSESQIKKLAVYVHELGGGR